MADYQTVRAPSGIRTTAAIDEGLRAHMNKVYGTMSVGMLVTAGVSWGVGTTPALLAIFRDPVTLSPNILGWAVMFAPEPLPQLHQHLHGHMGNRESSGVPAPRSLR
jgi:uncharacterized protein